METLLFVTAILAYGIGSVGYLIYLLRATGRFHRMAWGALLVGSIVHALAIVLRSLAVGHLAVTTSQEALSFFAWILVVTFLVIQPHLQLRILGSFVSPLAVLFMLTSSIVPLSVPAVPERSLLQSGWVVFHVASLFMANALFALTCGAGVMYLLQERQIKRKNFGFFYPRLPSLERLDKVNHYCLLLGFPLMTIGLVTGFVYAKTIWRSPWNWDPKEILSLVTWCIYAILLHERLTVGWRGRRAAWLAIFGFLAVLITFLGVNVFLKGHHTGFIR